MKFFKKAESEPVCIDIKGKQFLCTVCGHEYFFRKEVYLTTGWVARFDMLSANERKATCYVCRNCAYIHWFSI